MDPRLQIKRIVRPTLLPASFWSRVAAYLFDTSLALIPATFVAYVFTSGKREALVALQAGAMGSLSATQGYFQAMLSLYASQVAWTLLATAVVYGVGSVISESGPHQATWGKRLMGLVVESVDGTDLDPRQAALRFVAGTLSWASLNFGHAMIRMRADRRAMHDLIAGTQVMNQPMETRTRWLHAGACVGAWLAISLVLASMTPVDPVLENVVRQALSGGMGGTPY